MFRRKQESSTKDGDIMETLEMGNSQEDSVVILSSVVCISKVVLLFTSQINLRNINISSDIDTFNPFMQLSQMDLVSFPNFFNLNHYTDFFLTCNN